MRAIYTHFTLIWLSLFLLLMTGCASNVPSGVNQSPPESISVIQVQADRSGFKGRLVRWGGEIIKVENAENTTDVEVLGRELTSSGKPKSDGVVDGRFVARIPGFVDPAEYVAGKRLTVSGVVSGVEIRKVGEYEYPYPTVQVESYHLWPKEKQKVYYPASYYDPWPYYGPWGWYPYGRYPYYRYPYW